MPETVKLRFGEAVNAALRRAMETWPEALLYGEDVAKPGGVFGVTRRLRNDFGERVFDTPISESAIIGSAVGAAMMGRRPIVEIMWIDFTLVGIDQVINQAANVRYVSNGALSAPLTIRTQQGATPGSCAQHSQSLEALFAHVPGLRVCLPSTPQDAYDLLLSAVACDDPTLVIEARGLYAGEREEVVIGGPIAPVGGSRHRQHGSDLTMVTWGATARTAAQAAQALAAEGISTDLIETVWLNPFDTDAVLSSVERTGRLLVVHEANVTGGFGAEVIARVAESGVALRAAPGRLGLPDLRVPAAPHLSAAVLPTADRITDAARRIVAGTPVFCR
ncbi:alpha-ketoacid dehydrogenase subunit beta [Streptomyces sp. NBC_00353]|uniref:alpha-ketoacid dehydrogenase subunit beta n=1 Tax=Streptomyces sp. NBC_00353 TaxID=2975722 RepID=UPI002E2769B5